MLVSIMDMSKVTFNWASLHGYYKNTAVICYKLNIKHDHSHLQPRVISPIFSWR